MTDKHAMMEDLEFLLDVREYPDTIARRLGVQYATLLGYCRDTGRHDLHQRLKDARQGIAA